MLRVVLTILAALAAVVAIWVAMPLVSGRAMTYLELFLLVVFLAVAGWMWLVSHRRRGRQRLEEMRDSALW